MKTACISALLSLLLHSIVFAGPFEPREVFGIAPGRDLDAALKRAQTDRKRVLLFYWNSKEKERDPGLEMRYFAEREETKKVMKNNFVIVLLDREHKDVKPYLTGQNIEKAQWALIRNDGKLIKTEAVYGNPDVGLRVVNELALMP